MPAKRSSERKSDGARLIELDTDTPAEQRDWKVGR